MEGMDPMEGVDPNAAIERHAREVFQESVDALDMGTLSRLTRARYAALAAAAGSHQRPWRLRGLGWSPARGLAALVLLSAALWMGGRFSHSGGDGQPSFEDLEIVASVDGSSDPLEMLQNDLDFYDFADNATSAGPEASS